MLVNKDVSNNEVISKNVKFNNKNTIIYVKKLDYISIVGDIRNPDDDPNYSSIAQARTRRLERFSLTCPLISWNATNIVFSRWYGLII